VRPAGSPLLVRFFKNSGLGAVASPVGSRGQSDDRLVTAELIQISDFGRKHDKKTRLFLKTDHRGLPAGSTVETASEALAVSLNETGGIGWERMAQLTGTSVPEIQAELGGQVYRNPEGNWETADEYLSGNVRAKLKTAEAAAAINPLYRPNVEALQAVQPEDLLPGDIHARLGASWIPKSDVAHFIAQTLQLLANDVSISHAGEIATWSVKLDYIADRSREQHHNPRTKRMTGLLSYRGRLEYASPLFMTLWTMIPEWLIKLKPLQPRSPAEMKDHFSKWIWETRSVLNVWHGCTTTHSTISFADLRRITSHIPRHEPYGLRNNDLDPTKKCSLEGVAE